MTLLCSHSSTFCIVVFIFHLLLFLQGYMNMTRNPHVRGELHATGDSDEKKRCTQLYLNNVTFQEEVMRRAPLVRVMQRLYNVGVEVNRHQLRDLRSCDQENPQRFQV